MVEIDGFVAQHCGDFSIITVLSVDSVLTRIVFVSFSSNHDFRIRDMLNATTRLPLAMSCKNGTRSVISSK